jgi:hypothetical protein
MPALRVLLTLVGTWLMASPAMGVGTWTPLAMPAPGPVNLMLLLPDGTVMASCNDGYTSIYPRNGDGNAWYKLTPDKTGHYVNGTWTNRASMTYTRLFYATQVLPNGKVLVVGSEHPSAAGGTNSAELYDTINDSWSTIPVPAALSDVTANSALTGFLNTVQQLGVGPSMLLTNGTVMLTPEFPRLTNGTIIYNPASNSFANGPASLGLQYEASWVKLADNSILTIDNTRVNSASTNSERYIPALNRWIRDANVPVQLYSGTAANYGNEIGPALLLPSGKALFLGGNTNTAIYTPSGTTNAGTWAAGPPIPNQLGVFDGPAAMLPNGKIIFVGGCPIDYFTNAAGNAVNGNFFEYDPVLNTFTSVPSPNILTNGFPFIFTWTDGKTYTNNTPFATYQVLLLALPDGTVLCSRRGATNTLYIYQPDSGPLASSRPTILTVTNNSYLNYTVTGTLLNGVSAGAAFGDDWQMDGNYPLVRLTDTNNNVFYARTYNWNSGLVMASNIPVAASFALPPGLTNGLYSLQVTVCGNTSAPVQFGFTNDPMQTIPAQGITFSGPLGGPFSPSSQSYTLTNNNALPLNWRVNTNAATWLTVSTNMGTLKGNQAITNLAVSLTSAATNLGLGTYTANLLVTNQTAGTVQNLVFKLVVNPIVQNGGFETGDLSYWLGFGDPNLNFVTPIYLRFNYVYSGFYGLFLGQSASLGALSQSVIVNSNQYYLLSFWLTQPSPGNNNQFAVSYNGTNLFSQANLPAFGWVNLQFLVSSPISTNLLQFSFQNDTGAFGLDNISMVPINLSSSKPVIVTQPVSLSVPSGQDAGFSVGAVGPPPLSYQWYFGSTSITGATNSSLIVVSATSAAGAYSVRISNANGSVASSNAVLTVLPATLTLNGGFESGSFSGWTVSDTNLASIGTLKSNLLLVNSGNYSALLGNSNTVGSISQYIGTVYNQYYLISFTLANSSLAQSNIFNFYWNGVGLMNETNLPNFYITPVQFIAKAPSMLTQLLFTFQNLNGYFSLDDVSVEPLTAPVLSNVTWSNTVTSISWNTLPNVLYQLQYTTNLISGIWVNAGDPYVGDGSITTAQDSLATDPQRFYRVAVVGVSLSESNIFGLDLDPEDFDSVDPN